MPPPGGLYGVSAAGPGDLAWHDMRVSRSETARPSSEAGPTRRIVVGADISAAGSAALLWAMRRARRRNSHVMVLDSRPSADAVEIEDADLHRREHRWDVQAWVSEVLMSVGSRVPVLVSSTEGRLELALAGAGSRADLVVYGEDPDAGASLDARVLMRFCPCPVVRIDRHQAATWLGGGGGSR